MAGGYWSSYTRILIASFCRRYLDFELGSFNPNPVVRIGLALLRKVIKDKYLVLAGDYLHIRGYFLLTQVSSRKWNRSGWTSSLSLGIIDRPMQAGLFKRLIEEEDRERRVLGCNYWRNSWDFEVKGFFDYLCFKGNRYIAGQRGEIRIVWEYWASCTV